MRSLIKLFGLILILLGVALSYITSLIFLINWWGILGGLLIGVVLTLILVPLIIAFGIGLFKKLILLPTKPTIVITLILIAIYVTANMFLPMTIVLYLDKMFIFLCLILFGILIASYGEKNKIYNK